MALEIDYYLRRQGDEMRISMYYPPSTMVNHDGEAWCMEMFRHLVTGEFSDPVYEYSHHLNENFYSIPTEDVPQHAMDYYAAIMTKVRTLLVLGDGG